jgi:hypothetical protein
MAVYVEFAGGPLRGITLSTDSSDPVRVALAKIVSRCAESCDPGQFIRTDTETVIFAIRHNVAAFLPFLHDYFLVRREDAGQDERLLFSHRPFVG